MWTCALTITVSSTPALKLADALLGRLGRDALLVAARRAVAEAHRSEPVDLDDDVLLERAEELPHRVRVVRLHPLLALGLGDAFEHGPVRVPAHEPRVQAARQLVRLLGQRPPGQVAAGDDQVGVLALDLLEHGREARARSRGRRR